MDAINKTLARVQARIAAKEYYEAHQAVRTIVARYVRQKKWTEAIQVLYSSALLLAQAKEYGSVCDLCAYMLTVYTDGKIPCDNISKGRLAQVIAQIPAFEPALRAIARQAEAWMKALEIKGGDADVHHLFGSVFALGADFLDAEHHLLLGTKESAVTLANMHRRWAAEDEKSKSPFYYSRGVFGYLSVCDMRNANAYLAAVMPNFETSEVGEFKVSDEFPLMNFLQLLVAACSRRERAIYHPLQEKYNPHQYPQWVTPITQIESDYFGIQPQKEFNIMDLMGGFLK